MRGNRSLFSVSTHLAIFPWSCVIGAPRTLNVCADTIAPCLGDSKTAPGIWNYNYQQPYACFNLGDKSQATWASGTDATGLPYVSVKYVGGDSCYNTQPASQYTIENRFQCDESQAVGTLSGVVAGATQCDYIATFKTAAACSGGGAGGAGAWIFNGIVLGGLPLYFAIGFFYNWKSKGLEGNERIPHLSFWSDLPILVKDGCLYFLYLLKLLAFKVGALSMPPDAPMPSGSSGGYSSSSSSDSGSGSSASAPPLDLKTGDYGGSGAYGTI